MTVTDQEVQVPTAPDALVERNATFEARLAAAPPIDSRVRVTCWAQRHPRPNTESTTGVLIDLDRNDSNGTFYVRFDGAPGQSTWVHDVAPENVVRVAANEPVTEVLGDVDGPVEIGDTVKVLGCLIGASNDFQMAVLGTYAEVVDVEIVGEEVRLICKREEPITLDDEVLATWPIVSWAKVLTPASEGEPAAVSDSPKTEVLAPEIVRLTEAVDRQRRRAEMSEQALYELKTAVGEKVRDLTRTHGWCSVAKEAMEELGIEIPSSSRRITVKVEYTILAMPTSGAPLEITEQFVRDSLSVSDPDLDSDWEDFTVEYTDITIESVEEVAD